MSSVNSSSVGPLSPRQLVDSGCIPVSMQERSNQGKNEEVHEHQIIRPTPRRPTVNASNGVRSELEMQNGSANVLSSDKKAFSSDRVIKANNNKDEQKSMTDPRQAKSGSSVAQEANPIKLRSFSPKTGSKKQHYMLLPAERDVANGKRGFVTNVTIAKDEDNVSANKGARGSTFVNINNGKEDVGYQILSRKDEEAEGGVMESGQIVKPKRKLSSSSKASQEDQNRKSKSIESVNHLLDVKAAIERLKLNNVENLSDESSGNTSSSSSSSSTSSSTSNESLDTKLSTKLHHDKNQTRKGNNAIPLQKLAMHNSRHNRQSRKAISEETLNMSSVTSADEFVWIDSHNRLVELQQLPWTTSDIDAVVAKTVSQKNKTTEHVSPDILPRLSYYLQRVLVRIAREAQRLAKPLGKCGHREIITSLKV